MPQLPQKRVRKLSEGTIRNTWPHLQRILFDRRRRGWVQESTLQQVHQVILTELHCKSSTLKFKLPFLSSVNSWPPFSSFLLQTSADNGSDLFTGLPYPKCVWLISTCLSRPASNSPSLEYLRRHPPLHPPLGIPGFLCRAEKTEIRILFLILLASELQGFVFCF